MDLTDTVEGTIARSVFKQSGDSLRGRLFSLVEVAHLPPDERDALKRCIRSTTYDAERRLTAALRDQRRDDA